MSTNPISGLVTAARQSVVAFCQPHFDLNSFNSRSSRPQIVCITGCSGTSKNLSTFKYAFECVRPMNFWPTRQTLIVSFGIERSSSSKEEGDTSVAPARGESLLGTPAASKRLCFSRRPCRLLHNKKVIEPPQKKIPLLRRLAIVPHLQCLVVPHHRNDIPRRKSLPQPLNQFKPNR